MWTAGLIYWVAVTSTVLCSPLFPNEDKVAPGYRSGDVKNYKREVGDQKFIDLPSNKANNAKDNENYEESNRKPEIDEKKDFNEGEIAPIEEEKEPVDVVLEIVKPPSFIQSLFTWPPSFSWPPTFSWPPNFQFPSFQLPSFSWPSFLGGKTRTLFPQSFYRHYDNYPWYENYPRYDSYSRYNSYPRYTSYPVYDSYPRYDSYSTHGSYRTYDGYPRYESYPRYDNYPRYESYPRYDNYPKYNKYPNYESYPIYDSYPRNDDYSRYTSYSSYANNPGYPNHQYVAYSDDSYYSY